MSRKASDLKGLSPRERKKLTEKVARGANELQRKLIEKYDNLKNRNSGGCHC